MHPCQYSPEVLDIIERLIQRGDHVHDPFAGPGNRLAALCDRLGATFTGGDIEDWPSHDPRVRQIDATLADSYPSGDGYLLVTSPVYANKRCADYRNGPTPTTKTKGRRDYGIALGRALHPRNLARHTGRPAEEAAYWDLHAEAVRHWPQRAVVNVDGPISHGWCDLLNDAGYMIVRIHLVRTRRYGGLANAEKRAEHEAVIVATRPWRTELEGQLSLLEGGTQ